MHTLNLILPDDKEYHRLPGQQAQHISKKYQGPELLIRLTLDSPKMDATGMTCQVSEPASLSGRAWSFSDPCLPVDPVCSSACSSHHALSSSSRRSLPR